MTFELQLILFLICLVGTFVFAGSETGFVSWNRLKVSHLAESGARRGRWGLYLVKHKALLLSAVLIGSNICIVGASLFFNSLYQSLSHIPLLSGIPSPESWILTPVVVLFCEMLPKSLFRLYSFELTLKFIPVLLIMYFIALPVSYLISFFTGDTKKRAGNEEQTFKTKIREEMVMVAAEGARTGALFESANNFFDNVLHLRNRSLSELMQPLESFQKENIRLRQTVGSIRNCKFTENEIIIHDENGIAPVGIINLLDIILCRPDASISEFVHQALILDKDLSLGTALKAVITYQGNVVFLRNKTGCVEGLFRKSELFSVIFQGECPELTEKQVDLAVIRA